MSPGIERTLAVAMTDARARLRRPAFAWLLGALALAAYATIPDPSSGNGVFVIDGARARYTSQALAIATATLLPTFLGLFGFYVVNRAVGLDARTRVGPLVATTPVRRAEYLLGKYLGSAVLLTVVTVGYLACILGMHLVRGEGPLLLNVYVAHYLILALPCILGVAAFALLFESVPGLGGLAGDFLYFFLWLVTLPLAMEVWRGRLPTDPGWGSFLDSSGLGFAVAQVIRATGSTAISIGAAPFDPAKPSVDLPGFSFTAQTLLWRARSLLLPALLLLGALVSFRRFDPARSGPGAAVARRGPLALVQTLGRPFSRALLAGIDWLGLDRRGPRLLRTVVAEVLLTARLNPLLLLVAAMSATLTLSLPLAALRAGALPVFTALLVPLLADAPVRERQAGVAGIIYAAPGVRTHLVALKLATAVGVALLVTGLPAMRLLWEQPPVALSLILGSLLLASTSVLLGLATGSPKPFLALALGFWYLALSAGPKVPALDFAGFSAAATTAVHLSYAALIALITIAALALGRLQERLAA
jgi:hypothetical protein